MTEPGPPRCGRSPRQVAGVAAAMVVLLALAPGARAADADGSAPPTPRQAMGFRGDGSHRWPDIDQPPLRWSEHLGGGPDQGIRWRTPLGKSMSQPIAVGDRIFTLEEPDVLVCLDADSGLVRWRRSCDPLTCFPPEQRARGRELLERVQQTVYRQFELVTEYDWLRGNVPRNEGVPLRPERDDPAVEQRIAEIEALYRAGRWSQRTGDADRPTQTINPASTGHGFAVFDKGTPEFDAFYPTILRELLVDYGIAALAEHVGIVMLNSGQTQACPVSDGRFVYANLGSGVTACFDLDGNQRWMVWHPHNLGSLARTYGTQGGWFDHLGNLIGLLGNSPLLVDDAIITSQGRAIRSLDRTTGTMRWQYLLPTAWKDGGNRSYGTPAPMTLGDGRRVLIAPHGVILDLATGTELSGTSGNGFDLFGFPYGNVHCAAVGSPVVAGDRFFLAWAMGVAAFRVTSAGDGDGVSVERLWLATHLSAEGFRANHEKYLKAPGTLSPETFYLSSVTYDPDRERLYIALHMTRALLVFDAQDGSFVAEVVMERSPDPGHPCGICNKRVSPALVGGKYIYLTRSDGCTNIIDADTLSVVSAHNHIYTQCMRDHTSDVGTQGKTRPFWGRLTYPLDPAHRRIPWEVMKQRWYRNGNDWRRIKNFPELHSATAVYRDLVFQDRRIYLRAGDALYCLEEGSVDGAPPSRPTGLRATFAQRGEQEVLELRWDESTDNCRIHAYRILVDDREDRTIGYPLAEYPAASAQPRRYQVVAIDGSGNRSPPSDPIVVEPRP